MDILTVKQIRIEDYLHTLGHAPVRRQGVNLWYRSPLREEKVASFKVNTGLNCWYDFGLGKGGNVSAHFPHPACLFAGMGIGGETARKECLEICVSILLVWLFEEREKFR